MARDDCSGVQLEQRRQPVEQGQLPVQDFLPRFAHGEPFRAIDLGDRDGLAAARRPFDLAGVAPEPGEVEIAFYGECGDTLAAALDDLAEQRRLAGRTAAQLLLELTQRGVFGIVSRRMLALRD